MLRDEHRGCPTKESRNPYTCGLSGRTYSAAEVVDRVKYLARGISKELGWSPNKGTEWDKVIGIFSLNTVRYYGTKMQI
jgi:ribosome assembly protein SQT1